MNTSLFRLVAGFRRFKDKYFQNDANSIYQRLALDGQTPKTLLIGCSDSRVDPAIMTEASPGELFVVRNVANLIPPCEPSSVGLHGTSSALEFAVRNLRVENIIVLGHRQCGGIRALMTGEANSPHSFIGKWVCIAQEAKEKIEAKYPDVDFEEKVRLAEMEAIRVSLKNLQTFPFVQEAIGAKRLTLLGIYFDLEQGQLWELSSIESEFKQLPL